MAGKTQMAKEELKDIIAQINLSEEQGKALNKYLAEYINNWKKDIETKVHDDVEGQMLETFNERAKRFEVKLRKELTEKLTDQLTESITKEVRAESEKEFDAKLEEGVNTLNEYYENKFQLFCQEASKEVEKTLSESLSARPEQLAFNDIVGAVTPFVAMGDNVRMIEILENQDRTINELSRRLEVTTKEKAIAECLAWLPTNAQRESMKPYLEKAKNAEEVLDKFESAVALIRNTREIVEGESILQDNSTASDDPDVDIDEINDDGLEDLTENEDAFATRVADHFGDDDDEDDDLQEDYFDDGIKTVTASSEDEGEAINEGVSGSRPKTLNEQQMRMKHLYNHQ